VNRSVKDRQIVRNPSDHPEFPCSISFKQQHGDPAYRMPACLPQVILNTWGQFHLPRPSLILENAQSFIRNHIMEPSVILHTATSLDGRIMNFPADLELYYSLAAEYNPGAVLFGSSTILAAPTLEVPKEHRQMFTPPAGEPDPCPIMVIADSRGQIRCWDTLLRWPYFRGGVALCSESTPKAHTEYLAASRVPVIVAGDEHIDMKLALGELYRQYGVRVVRSDSGGALNSVLLKTGLVTEVSVLIHPFLAGGTPEPTIFDPERAGISGLQFSLNLESTQVLGTGIIHARYAVQRSS
jgi:2,5-diamino-6-(ribosylamino)-4(3H)-pyrimidinone 5'-phosphate reductase